MVGPQVGAGRFMVYPQPPTAPLRVVGGSSAELVLVEQLAGPAVDGLPYAQMMFVRIAVHGDDREPSFSVIAGSGDPVTVTSEVAAVHRKPGGVGYVGDVWLDDGAEPDGVYRISVGFDAVSSERWRLRIHNNDTAEYRFTAVVADHPGATLQPWIDVSPAPLSFELLAGQTETKTVSVTNFGTTGCTLTSVGPLPAALAVTTALPVDIPAAKAAVLTVRFSAPAVPPAPDGVISGSAAVVITPADSTATTTPGHNATLAYRATTRSPEPAPRFAAAGQQFTPHLGPQGKEIMLAGKNFRKDMVVRFGSVETHPIAPPKPFAAWVTVPAALQTGSEVTITVTTVGGTDTSTDRFRVLSEFDRSVRVLSQTGRAVPDISVFRFAVVPVLSGGEGIDEILDGRTDHDGRWSFRETTFHRAMLIIGGPGWTGIAAICGVDDWVGERLETINEAPNGGSVILLSWTSIPGLGGALVVESDRWESREVDVSTRDITINGSTGQVRLEKGRPAHAVDAAGHKCSITVIGCFQKFGLLQYAKE